MRSKGARLALVVAAVVLAVGAFMVLRDSDDGENTASTTTERAPAEEAQTTATAKPRPAPEVHSIRVVGGSASGGARRIEAATGETVRIEVSSADSSDDVHLHGYDLTRRFSPRRRARLRFKADIEGEFELELHDARERIATLAVVPR